MEKSKRKKKVLNEPLTDEQKIARVEELLDEGPDLLPDLFTQKALDAYIKRQVTKIVNGLHEIIAKEMNNGITKRRR